MGYLLYPINFFVWAYLLKEPATHGDVLDEPEGAAHRRAGLLTVSA